MHSTPAPTVHRSDKKPTHRRFGSKRRWLVGLPAGLLLLSFSLISCFSAPRYKGPVSDHFDGKVFRNQVPIEHRGFWDVVRWRWNRDGDNGWKNYEAPVVERDAPPATRVEGEQLEVTFVGHATVLLQTQGLNILTDPIWARRASPLSWAGPRRHGKPGLAFEDLPPIDVVLISHNHYDHLHLATLRRIAEEHGAAIYMPLGNLALLEKKGISGGVDMDWWQSQSLAPDVRLTCVPAQHFSGRGLGDRNATLWCGFAIECPGGLIYFAGDTGDGPHFQQVEERFGAPRLALLPIGAYLPQWFMQPVHIDPNEAADAHLTLKARTSVGIHFNCFELTDEGPLDPPKALREASEARGISPESFWVLDPGETRSVPE